MHRSLFVGALALLMGAHAGLAQNARWNAAAQGNFVVSLSRDARGEIWAGTEDAGVSRFSNGQWTTFQSKDGLGDNDVYAVTGDRLGRVWVGHLNHGVSVWNGKFWKNYDVTEGPLGERVFALATSPVDGDVWIAHNAGLTRYSLQNETWTHYTTGNGFPTNEISALAFDSLGRLYVGTQHEGILIGSPTEHFASWRHIKGAAMMPNAPVGEGLPSNRINALIVTGDDTIYAATDTGLARSRDGENWSFVRGANWREKVVALGLTPAANEAGRDLLREDYITSLREDAWGLLWIGYRQSGYEALRPATDDASILWPLDKGQFYPTAMLSLGDGSVLLGTYGGGVKISDRVTPFALTPAEQQWAKAREEQIAPALPTSAPFPAVASAPDAMELNRLLALVRERVPTPGATRAVQLPDDWATQGTWLGRYGRYWAVLSAMLSPQDYVWGAGQGVPYVARIGTHAAGGDSLRHWIQELYSADPRTLEMTSIYFDSRVVQGLASRNADPNKQKNRRQSEWNDNGTAYPMTKTGPDIYLSLRVPPGNYVLSLFNFNKDGHTGLNWARDYMVSLRPHAPHQELGDNFDFESQPEWVSSRWRDFWGSNWKRFAVRGPQELTVKIDRNYSFNTMLMGAFLDEINEEPQPYFDAPKMLDEWHAVTAQVQPEDATAETLWDELQKAKADDVFWWSANGRLFYQALLRYYQAAVERTASAQTDALWRRIGTCNYVLCRYPAWEAAQEKRGLTTARSIETELQWDGKSNYSGRGRDAILEYKAAIAPPVAP